MSGLTVSQVLDRAADLIEPEGKWTQGGSYALSALGNSIDSIDPEAACFCAMGAVYRSAGVSTWHKTGALELVDKARKHLATMLGVAMASWNDAPERTQPEVVAALRKAAALAREQGK